jgi:hypothetical protein
MAEALTALVRQPQRADPRHRAAQLDLPHLGDALQRHAGLRPAPWGPAAAVALRPGALARRPGVPRPRRSHGDGPGALSRRGATTPTSPRRTTSSTTTATPRAPCARSTPRRARRRRRPPRAALLRRRRSLGCPSPSPRCCWSLPSTPRRSCSSRPRSPPPSDETWAQLRTDLTPKRDVLMEEVHAERRSRSRGVYVFMALAVLALGVVAFRALAPTLWYRWVPGAREERVISPPPSTVSISDPVRFVPVVDASAPVDVGPSPVDRRPVDRRPGERRARAHRRHRSRADRRRARRPLAGRRDRERRRPRGR